MTDYSELKMRLRGGIFTYGDERAALAAIEAQEKRIAELEARDDAALREATILAVSLAETHWPGNMDWRPLDKTAGVITQINNMCAGLDARIAELEALLKDCADDLEAEVEARYGENAKKCMPHRYERDMAPVVAARAKLNGEKG